MSVIPFVIDMMKFTNGFIDGFTKGITDGINFVGNSVGKNDTSSIFFYFVLIFFPTVIPSVYTEGIFSSVKSLRSKFTDGNIFSVFSFVFINFLIVSHVTSHFWIKNFTSSSMKWGSGGREVEQGRSLEESQHKVF